MKEARIELYGRVQGVGFRGRIKRFADQKGIKGSVINLGSGGVLIVAQGKEEAVKNLIEWLRGSPGFSRVEKIDYVWGRVIKKYNEFRIVRNENVFIDKTKGFWNLIRGARSPGIENIPRHIAIIPDGNRRWALFKGLESHFGHYKSGTFSNIEEMIRECRDLGVEYLSFWGFSTENWSRSEEEKKALFDLIGGGIERFRQKAKENKIRFKHIGRKDRLPRKLMKSLKKLEEETKNYKGFSVFLCLDYGGRDEILRAVNKALKSGRKNLNEKDFMKFLDTADSADPDLIIRTSGENRISGFMPFQSAYAELYFSRVYFPEFGVNELRRAVAEYSKRTRRFGG